MSNNLYDNETLIRELTSNYMDKLFYFCLEKTGDRYEAENLASEIVINVLSSHKRCPATVNFSAWFWQIARNRSSMWAKKKNEHDRWISELDVSEYDIIDEDAITEDMILKKDDLELLSHPHTESLSSRITLKTSQSKKLPSQSEQARVQ